MQVEFVNAWEVSLTHRFAKKKKSEQNITIMSSSPADMSSPTSPGIPEAPKGDFFNETQWAVLMAFADAVVPSITAQSKVTDEKLQRRMSDREYQQVVQSNKDSLAGSPSDGESLFKEYLDDRPSKNPAFRDHCVRTVASVPESDRKQLALALSLLG